MSYFHPWPEEALIGVAKQILHEENIQVFVSIH